MTSIGEYTFYGCDKLESVIFSQNSQLINIGNSAFSYCSDLTSIMIPDSVTSIGRSAFDGCSNLTKIVIPDSVSSIGDYAFSNCSKLTNITLGENVTYIGNGAFSRCDSVIFKNPENWYVVVQADVVASSGTPVSSENLSDPAKAAELLTQTYRGKYWKRAE